MQNFISRHVAAGLLISILILIFAVGSCIAQEGTEVAGQITATFTDQKNIEIGDVEGHVFTFATSEGTNASAGKNIFMDGAQVVNYSTGDLIKGNGPQNGYLKITKASDTVFVKWEHKTATTLDKNGMPVTTFIGTFTFIGGTGQFANIKGGGNFKGAFVSKTEYTVDWEGRYSIGK